MIFFQKVNNFEVKSTTHTSKLISLKILVRILQFSSEHFLFFYSNIQTCVLVYINTCDYMVFLCRLSNFFVVVLSSPLSGYNCPKFSWSIYYLLLCPNQVNCLCSIISSCIAFLTIHSFPLKRVGGKQ